MWHIVLILLGFPVVLLLLALLCLGCMYARALWEYFKNNNR